MAVITTAAVTAGAGIYAAKKQGDAAKSAANTQAQGVANAQLATQQAQDRALPLIEQGFSQSRDAINNGANLAQQNLLSGQNQSISTLKNGYSSARSDAINGFGNAERTLDSAYNKATGVFEPVAQQGAGASQIQAALSGALGPQAQKQAFANYSDSPGQKYLRDQQEQALLRSESALGGGVSANGRVLSALQEQAAGNAAQNYNTNFSQLGQIAGRGDSANQNIANLQASLGQSKAGIQQQLASLLSGYSMNQGAGISGIQANGASNLANLNTNTAAQLAQSLQGQGVTQANTLIGAGSEQAQLAQNLGQAQSGADIYKSQNASPLIQGVQAGLGAYGAMGGNFNFLSGMRPPNSGGAVTDYTGNAYKNWVGAQ